MSVDRPTGAQRTPRHYRLVKGTHAMVGILWLVLVILLILWVLGFAFSVGGGLIHLLLVLALIVLIYNLVTGRRTL